MAACFNDLKDEESSVRRTRKLCARFLRQLEQQPEGKALFKSKFSLKLGEMKENIFTNSANDDCLTLKSAMNHKQQDILSIEYYRDAFKKNSLCKTFVALVLVLGIFLMK